MTERPTRRTKTAGVSFEPGVQEYLKHLSSEDERTVSYILNKLVKRHAQENGIDLKAFVNGNGEHTQTA
jgi:predicted DNA-binding protein